MLLVIEVKGARHTHRLAEGRTVIGRDRSCDVVVRDNSLSRRHLECILTAGSLVVRDLESRNGVWLGGQQIHEALITPGVGLRAGDVWLRFEAEPAVPDDTVAWRPEELQPAPSHERPTQDIGALAPDADNFEDDEEATPPAMIPAAAEGPGDGGRMIVRGDRWYVRDPIGGEEIEIVPRDRIGASDEATTGALPVAGANLPALRGAAPYDAPYSRPAEARPLRGPGLRGLYATRRQRIILGATVLALLLVVTAALLITREPKVQWLSPAGYTQAADRAALLFQSGKRDEALQQLATLRIAPMQERRFLAQILIEAIAADGKALANLSGDDIEAATERWDEVSKSRESTDTVREIARARRAWLQDEEINLAAVNDAQAALAAGRVVDALRNAAAVPDGSLSRDAARQVIDESVGIALAQAEDSARTRDWRAAVQTLLAVADAVPAKRPELDPKINEYRLAEEQRQNLIKAKHLSDDGQYAEALQLTEGIAEGPYVQEASDLAVAIRRETASKEATRLFLDGEGDRALALLTEAGQQDSPLGTRIRAILQLRERYTEAIKADQFDQAEAALQEIIRRENAPDSRYAREAQRNLDNLPVLIQSTAALLVDKASLAVDQRDYRAARKDYENALRLDPASVKAREGLKALEISAIREYNIALQLPKDNPDQALLILYDVRDRLSPTHRLYSRAEAEIFRLTKLKTEMQEEERKKAQEGGE